MPPTSPRPLSMTCTIARMAALASAMGALPACGGATGNSDSGFTISIESARYRNVVQHFQPPAGRTFVDIGVTIKNDSASAPVAANPVFFSLTTASHLAFMIDASIAGAASPCLGDVSVVVGGSLTCHLIFAPPNDDAPVSLAYKDERGRTASTPIQQVDLIPFLLPAAIYMRRSYSVNMDECLTGTGLASQLQLLHDAVDDFTFDGVTDDNGKPIVTPRVGNSGTSAVMRMTLSKGCTSTASGTRTFTVTADSEFDYAYSATWANRTGTCNPASDCMMNLTAHYTR